MKNVLAIIFATATVVASAQSAKVVSAWNTKESGEFDKARGYIDEAITNEKTMVDEKTWRYRGLIYQQIAVSEEDFGVDRKTALEESIKSFAKAKELDDKNKWSTEINQGYAQNQALAVNFGIAAYNEQNYPEARDFFILGADAAKNIGNFDTLAVYNAALAAEQDKDMENAAKYYMQAAESGYLNGKPYLYLANMYERSEMTDEYLATVKKGRANYPDDADLIVYELNYYLRNGKFEEAENNLKLALEKEPNNKQLHFSLGVVYDNLGNADKAVESYIKALEIDPVYFDATYNLGALYFNQGVEMNNKANDIKDNKAYDKARSDAKAIFTKAQPYLEKAHELDATDKGAMASLTQLYALVGETEKYTVMKAKLEAAK